MRDTLRYPFQKEPPMKSLSIREFSHHLAENLKHVIPHQEHVQFPGWRRKITRISNKKAKLTQGIIDNRDSER